MPAALTLGSTRVKSSPVAGRTAVRLETGDAAIEVFDDGAAPQLGRTGGGLYELELTGEAPVELMDLGLAHGARIRVRRG